VRITEFKVENFNTIRSVSLEEGDLASINVITGNHGQGKSSLLDALTYALTGYLEFSIASYIRLGEDSFLVYVRFTLHDVEYSLLIEGKEKGAEKVLKISSEPEKVYLNSDATKRLAEVLDPTLTLYSAVARQHNNTGVLFERDSERMEKLKKIFRMTQVDDAVERMKQDETKYKESIKLLKKEVELSEKQIEGIQIQKTPELPDESLLNKEETEWSEKKKSYDEGIEQRKKEDEHKRLYEQYVEKRDRFKEEMEYFVSELKALPEIKRVRTPKGLTEERGKLLTEIQVVDHDITETQKAIEVDQQKVFQREQLEMRYVDLTGKLSVYAKEKIDKEDELVKSNPMFAIKGYDSIEKAQSRKSELHDQLHFLSIKKQSHKSGVCLVCEHVVEGAIDDTEEDYKQLETILSHLNQDIDRYSVVEKEADDIKSSIKAVLDKIVEAQKEIDKVDNDPLLSYISSDVELRGQLETFSRKKKELSDKLNELNLQQRQYDTIVEQNNSTIAQKEKLEGKIKGKQEEQGNLEVVERILILGDGLIIQPFDTVGYNDFLKRKQEYEVLVMRVMDIESSNAKLKEQKKTLQDQIETCRKQIAEQEDLLDAIVSGKKFLDKKFSAHLLTKGSTYVCSKMNEFFGKASDFSEYELSMEVKGNSAQFFYTIDDHEKKMVVGKSSGQQQMDLGLAFRVAVGSIRGNDFYVLDEVDSDANDEASLKMFSTLRAEGAEQIFVVTHNEETKKYFLGLNDIRMYEIANGEAIAC
jgi:DNA repair exonuclease SbcCD ATPase subunit